MQVRCPKCGRNIEPEDVNVGKDTVFCRNCDEAFELSDIVHETEPDSFDIENPPGGAWFGKTANGFIVGARTRSGAGCFVIPFAIVWSGFSLGGIYGTQIASGEFNIVLSLFGIPFFIASCFLWAMALMTVWGINVIKVEGSTGKLFTGIGSLGKTKTFDWSEFDSVREEQYSSSNNQTRRRIVLEGKRRLAFGTMLSDERRYYVLKTLQKMLAEQ